MCTAITYRGDDLYFGRNLDFENSFGEKIVITARNFPFSLRQAPPLNNHYSIIGTGIVANNFPLYFDGANEHGLCMAGLLFKNCAVYHPYKPGYHNIASFELIPWILSSCRTLKEAEELLKKCNITNENFSEEYPNTPLHWIVSDKTGSLVAESTKNGLFLYKNDTGVLTNSPEFPEQMENLRAFEDCSFCSLPGDSSSFSRFVRAFFAVKNSVSGKSEQESVSHFFHMLESVYRIQGCTRKDENASVRTHYSSCINADKGIYYYTTYNNFGLNAVCLGDHDIECDVVYTFPMVKDWRVNFQR